MTIRFYRPPASLAGLVTRFYVHDVAPSAMGASRWRIVPDGEVKLIFPYQGGIGCTIGDGERWHPESRLIVSGMRDAPGELRFPAGVGAVVAVLRGDALHRLTGVPQLEITNRTLDGAELFGRVARLSEQELLDAKSATARVQLLGELLQQLMRPTHRDDASFDYALTRLYRAHGRLRVDGLARELGWSRRRLTRAFGDRVGLSPKRVAGVLRFHRVYKHLTRTPPERVDRRIIYDHYFDQSHFLKDFRRYSGTTPRSYEPDADYGRFYVP